MCNAIHSSPEGGGEPCGAGGEERLRVLVADDHAVVRYGVVAMLANKAGMVVVGQARNGRDALDLTRELRPDIVIMDIQMPEMNGIEATRLIKAECPDTVVIGMSAYCEEGFRTAMMDAGAVCLLDKAEGSNRLLAAIAQYSAARGTPAPNARKHE